MKTRTFCCICVVIFAIFTLSGSRVLGQSKPCTSTIPSSFGGIELGCTPNDFLRFMEKGSVVFGRSRMGHCIDVNTCREYVHSSSRSSCSDSLKEYDCGAHGFGGTTIVIPEFANGVLQKPYWACLQKETIDRFSVCEITSDKKILIPITNTGGKFIFANNKLIFISIMFQDDQQYKDLCATLDAKYGQCKTPLELAYERFSFATNGVSGLAYGGQIGAFHGNIQLCNLSEWAKIIEYDRVVSRNKADKKNAARELEKQRLDKLFK